MNVVAAYRRSGTHLLLNTLHLNFEESWLKSHDYYRPGKMLCEDTQNTGTRFPEEIGRLIYVVRHGMDALYSNYRWWKGSGESTVSRIQGQVGSLSFKDYIRGKAIVENITYKLGGVPKGQEFWFKYHFEDPITCWMTHIQAFLNSYIVRYEDLCLKPEKVMSKLQQDFDLEPRFDKYHRISHPVGHEPNVSYEETSSIVSPYRHFDKWDEEDIEYFEAKTQGLRGKLGYGRQTNQTR